MLKTMAARHHDSGMEMSGLTCILVPQAFHCPGGCMHAVQKSGHGVVCRVCGTEPEVDPAGRVPDVAAVGGEVDQSRYREQRADVQQ
jgi:hypothetical protein